MKNLITAVGYMLAICLFFGAWGLFVQWTLNIDKGWISGCVFFVGVFYGIYYQVKLYKGLK